MKTVYANFNQVDNTITVSNGISRMTFDVDTYLKAIEIFGIKLPAKYNCQIMGNWIKIDC